MVELCFKTLFITDMTKNNLFLFRSDRKHFFNLSVFRLLFMIYMGIAAVLLGNMLIIMMGISSHSLVINYQLTRCQHLAEKTHIVNCARNLKCQ
jgi:hypothetical protein